MGVNFREVNIDEAIKSLFEEKDAFGAQVNHQSPPVARADKSQEAVKQVEKNTLFIDVNDNPTKKGIKVQFALTPDKATPDYMIKLTQSMKAKLNAGLAKMGLSVDVDKDVPYSNVVGFLIDLEEVRLLIKSIINGGESTEQPSEQEGQPQDQTNQPEQEPVI
jgi:hypothetical protein